MELELLAGALKDFTCALVCLTKFGEDVDISVTPKQLKLSSVNSSRSAFGVFTFEPSFFERYDLVADNGSEEIVHIGLCVTTKALLSALKPRSVGSIESVSLTMREGDDPSQVIPRGEEGPECRLVVRLHCLHGVIKTHKLAYANSTSLYAKATRAQCTSSWVASSRVLRDWIDHFHLRTSNTSGGTAEISFYHTESRCRLRSYGEDTFEHQPGMTDTIFSRPMSTELQADVEDFDHYEIQGTPLINFALKEFKAIITAADQISAPLSAAFTKGGSPVLIDLRADLFTADFVIATTEYDGDSSVSSSAAKPNEVKKEKSEPRRSVTAGAGNRDSVIAGPSSSRNGSMAPPTLQSKKKEPLFLPASQGASQQQQQSTNEFDEDDEFDALEMGDDDFAEMDRLSQMIVAPSQSNPPPATGDLSLGVGGGQKEQAMEDDDDELEYVVNDDDMMDFGVPVPTPIPTQVGPTPQSQVPMRKKSAKNWNLFPS